MPIPIGYGKAIALFLSVIFSSYTFATTYSVFDYPNVQIIIDTPSQELIMVQEHLQKSLHTLTPLSFDRAKNPDWLLYMRLTSESSKNIEFSLHQVVSGSDTLVIRKQYTFNNLSDLVAISNQWGDLVIEKTLGFKGPLSYPLAYVEIDADVHKIMLSDVAADLKATLYSAKGPVFSLAWSPDAHFLAFVEMQETGTILKILEIQSLKTSTIEAQQLASSPCFSRDGQFLYYILDSQSDSQIIRYDLKTAQKSVMISGQDWLVDVSPGSDQYHLIVSTKRTGTVQVYDYNTLNKQFKRLTFNSEDSMSGVLNIPSDSLYYSLLAKGHCLLMRRSFFDHQTHYVSLEGAAESITFPPTANILSFERVDLEHSGKKVIIFKSLMHSKEEVFDCANDCYGPSWAPQPGIMNYHR